MNFAQKLSSTVKGQLSYLKSAHDRRVAEAEARAQLKLAKARTETERARAKLVLEREKLVLKRELYEAKTATLKAKAAVKKARLEAGDLTIGERLGATYRAFVKPKRRVAKRRKTVTKKRR